MSKHWLITLFLLSGPIVLGDLVPMNSHLVEMCTLITNADDYPEVSLIGYVSGPVGKVPAYVIHSDECLTKGYKFNRLHVCAVKKDYLSGKVITETDWSWGSNILQCDIKIECWGGYVNNASPLKKIFQYYKIAGFTNKNLILFKWQEVRKFNNGKSDSVITYPYEGDITKLSQSFPR